MGNYLYDAEIQRDFAEIRLANERARLVKEERDASLRVELASTAARLAEERRRAATSRLDRDLRAAFFTANPAATEEDFERLWPQIRDDHMRAAAAAGAENVFDRIRSEAFEREQETLDRRSRFEKLLEEV